MTNLPETIKKLVEAVKEYDATDTSLAQLLAADKLATLAQSVVTALAANRIDSLTDAFEAVAKEMSEAIKYTSASLEDLQRHLENKTTPTVDEVNMCVNADSRMRFALAQAAELLTGYGDDAGVVKEQG